MSDTTYALPAQATLQQAPALMAQVDQALAGAGAGGGCLRVDASALAEYDSSTIALLLHAQRVARTRGATVRVHGAPGKLLDLARLYGVEELLPLEPT